MKQVGFQKVRVWVGWTLDNAVDDWEGGETGVRLLFPLLECEGVCLWFT